MRERRPSSTSYGSDFLIISGLNKAMYLPSLSRAMILFWMPIKLAAMPTQPSLWAERESSKSWAMGKSSGVAGSAFWEGRFCPSYYCAVQDRESDTLRLICSSRSTRPTPSRMCPIPAMPEIAASAPLERLVPTTWVTPRTISITAVRFSPMW